MPGLSRPNSKPSSAQNRRNSVVGDVMLSRPISLEPGRIARALTPTRTRTPTHPGPGTPPPAPGAGGTPWNRSLPDIGAGEMRTSPPPNIRRGPHRSGPASDPVPEIPAGDSPRAAPPCARPAAARTGAHNAHGNRPLKGHPTTVRWSPRHPTDTRRGRLTAPSSPPPSVMFTPVPSGHRSLTALPGGRQPAGSGKEETSGGAGDALGVEAVRAGVLVRGAVGAQLPGS